MNDLLKVEISAETKEQADTILADLLAKKLVTGGQVIKAPATFLWKGAVTHMDYFNITSFTILSHKETVITAIEAQSLEEVPMITFTSISTNEKLDEWIKETVKRS